MLENGAFFFRRATPNDAHSEFFIFYCQRSALPKYFPVHHARHNHPSTRLGCFFLQDTHAIDIARDVSGTGTGTSINLGGYFALSLGGSRSQYLPSNASARDVKLALEAMDAVGTVDVERNDGDAEVRSMSQARTSIVLPACMQKCCEVPKGNRISFDLMCISALSTFRTGQACPGFGTDGFVEQTHSKINTCMLPRCLFQFRLRSMVGTRGS